MSSTGSFLTLNHLVQPPLDEGFDMGCRGLDFGGDRGTGGRVGWECFGSRVVHF